jgi:hypothetical protein
VLERFGSELAARRVDNADPVRTIVRGYSAANLINQPFRYLSTLLLWVR